MNRDFAANPLIRFTCFGLDAGRLRWISSSRMQTLPLGEKMRKLREDLGISLREFSRRSGVSPSFLSEVESGRRHPSPSRIEEIAKVLGVPVSELADLDHRVTLALVRQMLESNPDWGPVLRRIHAAATADTLKPAALMKKLPHGS